MPSAPALPSRRGRLLRRSGATLLVLALGAAVPLIASTGCLASLGNAPDPARMAALAKEAPYAEGAFVNVVPPEAAGPDWSVMKDFFFKRDNRRPPGPLPMENPVPVWAQQPATGLRITWLGHSTLLVEVDGHRVLTDPIWGERASPSTIVGPKRFHAPPAKLSDLPPLDAVVISHDHYDHLDMPTIEELNRRGVPFFVPLGVGSHLEAWGVPKERITELDWWGEVSLKNGALKLVATPSRHFSGRAFKRNNTLWASWVIQSAGKKVYFSGDTGLTPQFEEIHRRHGPFDLVMLEVGAFHPSWGDIHLGPDNAVKAHRMLGGGPLLPVHWGTFDLGLHPWDEPPQRMAELAREHGIDLLTPRLGGPVEVAGPRTFDAWWRQVEKVPSRALSQVPSF